MLFMQCIARSEREADTESLRTNQHAITHATFELQGRGFLFDGDVECEAGGMADLQRSIDHDV